MMGMKLALSQINPTVGDIEANTKKIAAFIKKARLEKAGLVIFPELAITGYPPEDLVLKPQFITDNLSALKRIVKLTKGITVFLGFIDRKKRDLFNAGAFIADGRLKQVYHKMNLPNYAVFDEKRYFKEGKKRCVIKYQGAGIGLKICEDVWAQRSSKAPLILVINASPYSIGRVKERERMLRRRAKENRCYMVYVNMVGGQDELVFDGGSMVFGPSGKMIGRAAQYREELLIVDLKNKSKAAAGWMDEEEEIYQALLLGVKDYVNKNGFSEVVLGLSGGIDSALTLAIAVDALGKDRVHALFMPSDFTSTQSAADSRAIAKNLGVNLIEVAIKDIYSAYLDALSPHFQGRGTDITEENIQARIRGNFLMALSNKFGWLVLTTGNKSEMSVGYCTLYGDMAGGFGVLKDIVKTRVYRLAGYRNRLSPVIPETIIRRPPTAELRPEQLDQDTLPPYENLDRIISAYVEENKSYKQIVASGIKKETVSKIIAMIDRAEYKRRQSPPGPRVTGRAFGKDWRVPITNHFKHF
jgi:NAD+ synthase (glutamine-hydrolysing)